MTDTGAEETRISELLWRTVKLRVSLLVVAIIVLLIVWSAVLSGNLRAVSVDVDDCRKLVAIENASTARAWSNLHIAPPIQDVTSTCSTSIARSYIEGSRGLNAIWRDVLADLPNASQAAYSEKEALFSNYDSKRRSSYDFQIQLSSQVSSSQISLNALTVAEVVPFLTLGLAAIVIVLGFQQRAYKVRLAQLSYESEDSTLSVVGRTQFFTLRAFAAKRYSPRNTWLLVSVEGLAVGALAAALIATWFGLLFSFAENVVHLTDSITHNYVSELFGAAFLLAIFLAHTRQMYRGTLEPRVGSALADGSKGRFRVFAERSCVVVALVALLLPWTTSLSGLSLKGCFFLLPERPVIAAVGSVFPISPQLFSELRWQLTIALVFVAVCGVVSFWRPKENPILGPLLGASRAALAIVTLNFSLNLFLYMSILEYEAIRGTSWDLQNMLSNASHGHGAGLPLLLYDPSYGLFVFLAACTVLIRYSFLDVR